MTTDVGRPATPPSGGAAAPARFDELIQSDRVHGSLYTDPAIFDERARAHLVPHVGLRRPRERGARAERLRAQVDRPAAGDHEPRQAGRDPPAAQPLRAPGQPRLRRRARQLERLPLPVPRLDLLQHRQAARLPVQQRLRRHRGARRTSGSGGCRASRATRGFVFGSFAEEGPSLREHLGAAAEAFDRLARALAGRARSQLTAGWLKHKVKANWKMLLENETDGYHPQFVHASIFSVADSGIGDLYGEKSTAVDARPRRRPHRERPAAGVPPHRPAAGLVRHRPRTRARLRRADARGPRRGGRARS